MGTMRALRVPGGGWSCMATCSRDRSSFNTEPGLRFSRLGKKAPAVRSGGFFASCPGQRLGAEIFTNGFVIQPGCAPAAVVRSPGRHIGLTGNKALLHQYGGTICFFQKAKGLLGVNSAVALLHHLLFVAAFIVARIVDVTHARVAAQALARRAEFIGNEMRKAQRILVMGAPRRLRIAFQAIGIRGIRV